MSRSDEGPLDPIGMAELARLAADGDGMTRTLRCRTVAKRGYRQEHHVRDLAPFGSSPDDENGIMDEANAPQPAEMLLAALGACLVIGIHANAVARGIPIARLELELSAETSFGALWGAGDLHPPPIGFESIGIEAHIQSDAPRKVLQGLMDHALLWSPVANILHDPIVLTASVAEP